MLATARDLAAGDDMMLGLIEDVASETTKGVVSGPVYNNARIGGGQTDTYRAVPFEGGTYAEIYVEAKGSNDLNLKVTDDQGGWSVPTPIQRHRLLRVEPTPHWRFHHRRAERQRQQRRLCADHELMGRAMLRPALTALSLLAPCPRWPKTLRC